VREDEKAGLIKLYEDRYAQMGYDVRTVGWGSRDDQRLRFKVLCDIADLAGTSICDVGCGFGDLADYLAERFGGVSYTGVDLSPSLVAKARERHPALEFHCLDLLQEPFERTFDYVLLSGALNYRVEDNLGLTTAMLERMYGLARRGVGANFLTSYVNFERPYNFHHAPGDVIGAARRLTRWVALRHDYPLWEFTVHLYRESPESHPAS
jgi:SAM-dependent methyltransferase